MKIAVADDEEILLAYLQSVVQSVLPEAEVYAFSDTMALLETAEELKFDIAFLDIQMPGMNGLELAKELCRLYNSMNIIFATGFDGYQGAAMDLFASGYVKKPVTKEKIEEQLKHLRYPLKESKRLYAVTFGNFALYADGKPVTFHRRKSAELLAYLILKSGTVVSRSELTLELFEDETHSVSSRKNLDNAIRTLRDDLAAVGADEILYRGSDGLAVNREKLDVDFFDYQHGERQLYHGQFLEQFSWSEYFKEDFV